MKRFLPILCLTLTAACSSPDDQPAPEIVPEETAPPKTFNATGNDTQRFREWMEHYAAGSPALEKDAFVLREESSLEARAGSIEPDFDPPTEAFASGKYILSPDKKRYIDIDTYQGLHLDKAGNVSADSPDQEIDLVDMDQQTVTRIAFRGPSQSVEEAFWKSNTVVCLLEASSDGHLSVTEIDLKNRKVRTYAPDDSLRAASKYTAKRLKRMAAARSSQP